MALSLVCCSFLSLTVVKVITANYEKVTKYKGVFTSDMTLLKLIYLATDRIQQKWSMPLANWAICAAQLKIIFANRMKTDL